MSLNSKTLRIVFTLLALFYVVGCAPTSPQEDCNALAEVSCQKLQDCMGFEYASCVADYKRSTCTQVEDVSNDFARCYIEVATLTCNGTYPPESCDNALIMKELE